MKTRDVIIIAVIILIGLLAIQQYLIRSSPSPDDVLLQKINRIEAKLDSLSTKRDSLKSQIERVDSEVTKNQESYEKEVSVIINNTDSANRVFIDNYIKEYIERITK